MKAQAKSLGTVHESLVHVTYVSRGGGVQASVHIHALQGTKNHKETRVADGNFVAGR